jgi:ergothioneine biosynthesis protein EgtC
MCRLLGYIGSPIQLDSLLYQPEHSLVHQSYQPQEMTAGLMNADGFGVGWYDSAENSPPYTYKNILPIWSDVNLPHLSRYVKSECVLAYVRSATPPLVVDVSNCQPFSHHSLLYIHNGFINDFRQALYRPIRNLLDDYTYEFIMGTTDSEHIFALILHELRQEPTHSLTLALKQGLTRLIQLAEIHNVYFSANIILSNGKELVASRYANRQPVPTLYWLKNDSLMSDGVIIASEPLFKGDWNLCPEHSLITVTEEQEVIVETLK